MDNINNYLAENKIKTHFWDRKTMRGFGTRILRTRVIGDRLVVLQSDRHPLKGRIYRIFVVNPKGNIIQWGGLYWFMKYRESLETFYKVVKEAI